MTDASLKPLTRMRACQVGYEIVFVEVAAKRDQPQAKRKTRPFSRLLGAWR